MSIQILVLSDVSESGRRLIEEVLRPAGYEARLDDGSGPAGDIIVVDVSRLRGAPLAGLRARRDRGDTAPAILLAARLTEDLSTNLFPLGIREFLVKPVDAGALGRTVANLHASHASGQVASEPQVTVDETARANETLRQRVEEMRTVMAVGQAVVKTTNLDTLLGRIVEAGTYLTGAEEGALYLVDPATNELVLRASKDPGQVYSGGQRLRVGDSIAGEVFRTGRPIVRRRSSARPELKVKTGYLVNALVNVPLRGKRGVMGVLGVYNRSAEQSFEDRHAELLQAVADWASIAIENATLVERLERGVVTSAETLKRLKEEQRVERAPIAPTGTAMMAPPGHRDGLLQIMGECDGLLAAWKDPMTPGQAETITRIRNQASDMLEQLDTSENLQTPVGAGTVESPGRDIIGLPQTLKEVVKAIRPKAEEKGLSLEADLSGEFPPVLANPARLRQVFEALLTNSIRMTESGRIVIAVYRFRVKAGVAEAPFPMAPGIALDDGQWIAASISDTGPGLSTADLASLKNARASEIPSHNGPGISLGAARLITEAQGGRLWVEQVSSSGHGAVITVALPVV